MNDHDTPAAGDLSTLTVTTRERIIIANALVITTAIAEKLAPDTVRLHMELWSRVMEGVPADSTEVLP